MATLSAPPEIAKTLASRAREHRLARGWSQAEVARRAGVKPATYVLFERSGRVSLVGTLATVRGGISFEYAASSLSTGHELAPLALPLGPGFARATARQRCACPASSRTRCPTRGALV